MLTPPAIEKRPLGSRKDDEHRRKELAGFLRSRRARVQPECVENGMKLSRRRTPGLRREEVAELSGVSTSWYTWLEQGRDVRPSIEFLLRLGQVLRLNSLETGHLFDLAGRTLPNHIENPKEEIPESLNRLVTEILPVPAFVLGERFEFVLWNQLFTEQVFDLEAIRKERRTWLDVLFVENHQIRRKPEWEELARRSVAEFRWSIGKRIGTPWVKELVNRLLKESTDFSRIWKFHDVEEHKKSRVLLTQYGKSGKRFSFLRSIYIPAEAENLRLMILCP